ncbi:MAG: cytochrome b6-f complex subunit PetN [Cyanobacteria bacterium P01_D01_bin.156]
MIPAFTDSIRSGSRALASMDLSCVNFVVAPKLDQKSGTIYRALIYRMIERPGWAALLVTDANRHMDILTLGWIALLSFFSFSITMVIWGRNGF